MIKVQEYNPEILLSVAFRNKETAFKPMLKKRDIFTDKQRDYIKQKLKELKKYRDNPTLDAKWMNLSSFHKQKWM